MQAEFQLYTAQDVPSAPDCCGARLRSTAALRLSYLARRFFEYLSNPACQPPLVQSRLAVTINRFDPSFIEADIVNTDPVPCNQALSFGGVIVSG